MISLTLLAAALAAAAPAPAPAPGPAGCAARAGSPAKDPESLDDLEGCQRRALDSAAVGYAQANGGKLPAEALLARWQKAQDAEKAGFLARHPERRGPSPQELAAREERKPRKTLTVYVAPWCPHCREATDKIVALKHWLAPRGVETRIVVGQDKASNCENYSHAFGGDTELDPSGALAPGGGVPHFTVTDPSGGLLKDQAGVNPSASVDDIAAELGLP
jgi:hypothetical protein